MLSRCARLALCTLAGFAAVVALAGLAALATIALLVFARLSGTLCGDGGVLFLKLSNDVLDRVCGAVRLTYAPKSITPCLRGATPEILHLATTTLTIPGYNPSILKADGGGYIVSLRQDWLTQCSLKRQSSREAVKRAYEGARDRKRHTVIARTNSSSFARLRIVRRVPDVVDVRLFRGDDARPYVSVLPSTLSARCARCKWRTHIAPLRALLNQSNHVGGIRRDASGALDLPSRERCAAAGLWSEDTCSGAGAGRNHAVWRHPRLVVSDLHFRGEKDADRPSGPDPRQLLHPKMILHGPNGKWVSRDGSAPVTCPHRMSLSTPLIVLDGVLVGIGHFHRGFERGSGYFGSRYTHYLYALDASWPHEARSFSNEFCFASRQPGRHPPYDPRVCDTMQFATGLEIEEERGRALIAYGVNDCSAHVATMPLATLRRLLWPEGRPPVQS